MKKTYVKPKIMFEKFSLCTSIAGDCGVKTNNPTNNLCGLPFTGIGNVFLETMNGCNGSDGYPVKEDDGSFNGICYHTPTEGNNLFNS